MGFVSLYTAFGDLQASQARIDTASHYVSNAATPGYTSDHNAMNTAIGEIDTVRSQLSQIEDVDRAEAVLELQMQQTAYETALAAFGRASRPSLVDFLR
jgi:flagellar hook-associated protein 3 FlgL